MERHPNFYFSMKILLLLLGIHKLAAISSLINPLDGKRAPCAYEGEPVAVDHIDKRNCFSCICKNGFVACKNDYQCPPTDGCHMLAEVTADGCCKKCKGCVYNGEHHLSHSEWTDSANPCRVLHCEAGVVTISDLQCYTPCSSPLPPQPGKCCATCPECKINGQIATDDQDVIPDDPCLKCRCGRGGMICSKKACPVLQCAAKRQEHPPGECCPRCSGTRSLINVPKTCTLQSSFHRQEQSFNIDRCTNCTCRNETSICQRAACPVLDCPSDLQVAVPGSCCKKCTYPEEVKTQCTYAGKYYEDGQSWKLDACRSCKCHKGMPSCAMTRCNVTLPCPPGTQLAHLPGECCEKCVEVEGVCMVFGDPHYKTFDGKIYTFQGTGKYQLISDCHGRTFSIRVANARSSNARASTTTRRVAIKFGDVRLNLQQKGRVKLNGNRVVLPYRGGAVRIDKVQDDSVEVALLNGVKLLWSGKSFLEVSVPAKYKGRLCGLCGNFNSNVQDELRTRRGHVLQDGEVAAFGASWCVGPRAACARAAKPAARVQCGGGGARPEKNRCKYLSNNELFAACDTKLNYNKYYKACKMDMCGCPNDRCHCDSLMAYARECERLGVALPDWRGRSLCAGDGRRRRARPDRHPMLLFTQDDIERLRRQRNLNKPKGGQAPLLIQ